MLTCLDFGLPQSQYSIILDKDQRGMGKTPIALPTTAKTKTSIPAKKHKEVKEGFII